MDDVFTGSFLLQLLSLAMMLGYWIGSRSYACTASPLSQPRLGEVATVQVDTMANRPSHPIGQWLVRVARASCAPSSDDASAVCDAPGDLTVGRARKRFVTRA